MKPKQRARKAEAKKQSSPADVFHPELWAWFTANFRKPTEIQNRAWPTIARGNHSLITAPTGSGKTLTAFLWAINQLVTGSWPTGTTQALYISPLKALNNDIQRNLIQPLSSIQEHFEKRGLPFPSIRVLTRSGDTPSSERQRMIRKPPEILITTPESLNLYLASPNGSQSLNQIKTIILDEIHALVDSKRGVYLMSAVERLSFIASEFQRIALSATVHPLEAVARFVGGYEIQGPFEAPQYQQRSVQIIESKIKKKVQLQSCFPDTAVDAPPEEPVWVPVAEECKRRIAQNRSTLIFTNNRALCEKITLLINSGEPELIAYAHHGSLSREIRLEVEERLKAGDLKAIVATHSLELGIDVGELDEVILIQCPATVASTLQRLGRAGHRIGEVSKGFLITTHPRDFIESAAMLRAVDEKCIEASHLIHCPLDILPQIIVSMIATSNWTQVTLFNALRACEAFHSLSEAHFELVLNMMLGKFAETRIHDLRPLIGLDSRTLELRLRQGTIQRFYLNAGVIPNRGYYHLRHSESQSRIGELDEEYVWEASIGQTLTLGTQHWRIDRITHNDVFVSAANPKAPGIPFWRADDLNRSFHFSERIGHFLEQANASLSAKTLDADLSKTRQLDRNTRKELAEHLRAQRDHTQAELPHRHHLLVEITSTGPGSVPGNQVILHTLWGGRVNRPFSMALHSAWDQHFKQPIEIHTSNDCVALILPQEIGAEQLLSFVTTENVEALLRDHLESSGFFAARFRECAGRALLISKRKFNDRLPLWMSRLRSQKLFEATARYPDFPITLETWRTCLHDEFDLPNLLARLDELESGAITWSQVRTHQPSPMARSIAWRQVNEYLYRPDTPGKSQSTPSLDQKLVQELLGTGQLNPGIPKAIIQAFEAKRKRLANGYSPDSANELSEWLKERLVIPEREWEALLAAIERDHGLSAKELLTPIHHQLLRSATKEYPTKLILHTSLLPRFQPEFWKQPSTLLHQLSPQLVWTKSTSPEPDEGVAQDQQETRLSSIVLDWLQYSGPIEREPLAHSLGVPQNILNETLNELVAEKQLLSGNLKAGSEAIHFCLPENLEILLRMKRRAARPHFEALPANHLQVFLAYHQRIQAPGSSSDGQLIDSLNGLLCYPSPAALWESEILPARVPDHSPKLLDVELQESQLLWMGAGAETIQFCYENELHLAGQCSADADSNPEEANTLMPDLNTRYGFTEIVEQQDRPSSEVVERLWKLVWNGHISNDRFSTLRHGAANQFKIPHLARQRSSHRPRFSSRPTRSMISKWKGARPSEGQWFRIPEITLDEGSIEFEEIKKDRVRLLLDRYGILFRELLWREGTEFSWKSLFRTLRIMEFSGEVTSGYFFEGIPGPQFISQTSLQRLRSKWNPDRVFWINASDPASLCGISIPKLRPKFPRRIPSNHLVFRGVELVIRSESHAKRLSIEVEPEDPQLPLAFGFLKHLLHRAVQPLQRVNIEQINGEPAQNSRYLEFLRTQFEVVVEPSRVAVYPNSAS